MLGQTLTLADRAREAVASLERASVLAPHSPLVQMELGLAHRSLGEHAQAARCFEKGIALARELPAEERPAEADLAEWKKLLDEARAR
jgi:Flp pilus assembly protein TadD